MDAATTAAVFAAVFAAAALVISTVTLYVMITKPRMEVRFLGDSNELSETMSLQAGKLATLQLSLHNVGGWQSGKRAATAVSAFVYFHTEIQIKEVRRYEEGSTRGSRVFSASPSGRFANMKYVAVPSVYGVEPPSVSIISYDEAVVCEIDVVAPVTAGNYPVIVQMASREGGLGLHGLEINVTAT